MFISFNFLDFTFQVKQAFTCFSIGMMEPPWFPGGGGDANFKAPNSMYSEQRFLFPPMAQ